MRVHDQRSGSLSFLQQFMKDLPVPAEVRSRSASDCTVLVKDEVIIEARAAMSTRCLSSATGEGSRGRSPTTESV